MNDLHPQFRENILNIAITAARFMRDVGGVFLPFCLTSKGSNGFF